VTTARTRLIQRDDLEYPQGISPAPEVARDLAKSDSTLKLEVHHVGAFCQYLVDWYSLRLSTNDAVDGSRQIYWMLVDLASRERSARRPGTWFPVASTTPSHRGCPRLCVGTSRPPIDLETRTRDSQRIVTAGIALRRNLCEGIKVGERVVQLFASR
jgi:hypothetical protein